MKRGDPLGFINILSGAKYQKIRRGDSFETLKIFEKKIRTVPKKNWKGGPFAVSLHWSNLAWVNLSVSVKSGTYAMSSVVWRKKEKKLATLIVGLFSLKEKAPTKKLATVIVGIFSPEKRRLKTYLTKNMKKKQKSCLNLVKSTPRF